MNRTGSGVWGLGFGISSSSGCQLKSTDVSASERSTEELEEKLGVGEETRTSRTSSGDT